MFEHRNVIFAGTFRRLNDTLFAGHEDILTAALRISFPTAGFALIIDEFYTCTTLAAMVTLRSLSILSIERSVVILGAGIRKDIRLTKGLFLI